MKSQKTQATQITRYVREVVKKEHPETVGHLIRLVQKKYSLPEQEIMNAVNRAGLRLAKPPIAAPSGLKHYLATPNGRWYWFTIALCLLTATFVLLLPEINPLVYIRYLFGSVFALWIPGYCLIKNLYHGKKIEKLEFTALSFGTSILLVPMIGFVLHYTPWGIKTESATIFLLILTLALSTLAIVREHHDLPKR